MNAPHTARRTLLKAGALAAPLVAASGLSPAPATAVGAAFAHGVASGDPLPDAVVIWTRITPTNSATPGSGLGPEVTLSWQVSLDASFNQVVRRGTVGAGPLRDHTAKVDVTGLRPATTYYYRFSWKSQHSRVGRMRTAPAADATPTNVRFGVVSCANLQAGWFSAYRHLAARNDLHAIVHLGDYLYEYGPGDYGYGQQNVDIRAHLPAHEMVSLADYRQRHAQYKQDPDLQQLHARYAFITTWDDHEVTNDAWANGAENHQPATEGNYTDRRIRAQRAYDEWMPIRLSGTALSGDGSVLYRRFRFGNLAELTMLDLRSYRTQQPDQAGVSDPTATITGPVQRQFLLNGLSNTRPQWRLVGNPVMIAPVTFAGLPKDAVQRVNDVTGLLPADGLAYNTDQWDGYTQDRRTVFEHIEDHGVRDVVFLTGDIHSGWACDLPLDTATYPISRSAGVEFVCASVTSNNLKDITGTPIGTTSVAVQDTIKLNNRHVKYLDFDNHGFSVVDFTAKRAQMDWFVIGDRRVKTANVRYETSYQTLTGTSQVVRANGPVA